MVATNDGLYSVGAHQADYYDLVYNSTCLLRSFQLITVGVAIGGHAQFIVTPMQKHRSTKVFSVKSYISPTCESFLPRKFPAIRYQSFFRRPLPVTNYMCMHDPWLFWTRPPLTKNTCMASATPPHDLLIELADPHTHTHAL